MHCWDCTKAELAAGRLFCDVCDGRIDRESEFEWAYLPGATLALHPRCREEGIAPFRPRQAGPNEFFPGAARVQ